MIIGLSAVAWPLRISLCLVATSIAPFLAGSDPSSVTAERSVRLAVSQKVMSGVNLNDARAALTVWGQELSRTVGVNIESIGEMFLPSDQLVATIREGRVDLFCLTVQEFRQVRHCVDTSQLLVEEGGGHEFVLLVRNDGGIANLAGLRGRNLILHESPQTNLAETWLAVTLAKAGLGAPGNLLSGISKNFRPAQVVLPVYFGKVDACLLTRRTLNTMYELNPQLSRSLRVMAASPVLVHTFFAAHRDSRIKVPIFTRMTATRQSLTAMQVLTLFHSSGFIVRDDRCLVSANSLLDEYDQLASSTPGRKR